MLSVNTHFLFASDLDGTLLPNGEQSAGPNCLENTWQLLKALRQANCPIVYSSGRYLKLAREGQKAFRLLEPDYWICNVGSEIYNSNGVRDKDWEAYLGEPIDQSSIVRALSEFPKLVEQETSRQGPHKFSFYYPELMPNDLCRYFDETIMRIYPQGEIVRSIEANTRRCLIDIVPRAAGKANALDYLAKRLGFENEKVCFSGDSGNDLDALTHGFNGILVGNADAHVREKLETVFSDRPDAHTYTSAEFYGQGVTEGLTHYGFIS